MKYLGLLKKRSCTVGIFRGSSDKKLVRKGGTLPLTEYSSMHPVVHFPCDVASETQIFLPKYAQSETTCLELTVSST